jgi:hypothetical protein
MKRILMISGFLAIGITAQACEFCGCGVGNFYLGILPQFHRQFVGIRYQAQRYDSHVGLHPSLATSEYFQSTELWGRFYPVSRLQILTLVPYHINQQTTTSGNVYLDGLGDIPILANYNLYNTIKVDPLIPFKHSVWLGGGIKLPTGKFNFIESPDAGANQNFQLGTGSVDFMLSGIYTLRYEKWGINSDVIYKVNTFNANNYKFGNKLNGSVSFMFIQQIQKVGLMPYLGFYSERSAKNLSGDVEISDSGGATNFVTGGVEFYWKKISMGFNYRTPFSQNLANGRIVAHDRLMAHVTFLFY